MATKVFCYRATFDHYEAFGATARSAVKILEEVVRMRDGARLAARAEREATVLPIVPGALHRGLPLAGFEDLPEAGGRWLARGRSKKHCSKCRGTGTTPCRDRQCNLRLQGNKSHSHTCAICGGVPIRTGYRTR